MASTKKPDVELDARAEFLQAAATLTLAALPPMDPGAAEPGLLREQEVGKTFRKMLREVVAAVFEDEHWSKPRPMK